LLGIVLASTFFAGINIGADTAAKQALEQELNEVLVDVYVSPSYDYMTGRRYGLLSSENVTSAMNAILGVEGVKGVEVNSRTWVSTQMPSKNLSQPSFNVVGISEGSHVYDGWKGVMPIIGENETYIWAGSPDAKSFDVGDIIPLNLSLGSSNGYAFFSTLNLTVAGSAELSDDALAILTGQYYNTGGIIVYQQYYPVNLLITSWEKTFAPLLDMIYKLSSEYSNIEPSIYVYLDHEHLISPWDITGSVNRLRDVTFKINNAISKYYLQASNQLESILNNYQGVSFGMRFTFIISALPVFFVALYMGSTVSDVSFNLRRQEIGLLMTKGFSRRQLLRMFLFESALIGLLGGAIGILLSLTLSPWFVATVGGQFSGAPVIGPDSLALTLIFAVIVTFLSAYRPARRASNMAAIDALREYMYVEEVKPHRQLLPWAAFIFGSFKIVVLLLGINFQAEMTRLGFPPANILLFFLLATVVLIDGVLTYIGPFLFFWGFTKLFIRGSLKFQEVTAKAFRFLGDLGELATKSVRRNPARAAAVAFLIAFIIGYSVQIVGTLASEQDFGVRQTYFNVGADVSVALSSPMNASKVIDNIHNNVSQIESMTVEHGFSGSTGLGTYGQSLQLRAVNASEWLSTAYYESDLFSGVSVEKAFEDMRQNNHTIILERSLAEALNKNIGGTVTITVQTTTEELTVVGYFGTEQPQQPGGQIQQVYYPSYWSYVPVGWYKELGEDGGYSSTTILIKLESGTDGKAVANEIRGLNQSVIVSVSSVAEQLEVRQSNYTATGSLNILRLGVIFIVLAASVGITLITLVGQTERSREASIMSVRGLSYRQLVVMLLTENLAVVVFAVLLGAAVGLVWVRGTIASNNAFNVFGYNPVIRHMVFPPDALLIMFISFALVFASTIVPVIIMAKRYSSRLERVVRQA
jgi:ABC-type antimicrobial peptide transport system permease subunit